MGAIFATIASKDIDRAAVRDFWIKANVLSAIATLENFAAVHMKKLPFRLLELKCRTYRANVF